VDRGQVLVNGGDSVNDLYCVYERVPLMARLFDFVAQSALMLALPWCLLWLSGCRAVERAQSYGSTAPRQWMRYQDPFPEETFTKAAESDGLAIADVDTPENTSDIDTRVKHNRH